MAVLLVLGSIILLLGIFLLVDRGILKKMQDTLNKSFFKSNEQFAYKYRIPLGGILMVLGCILLFMVCALKNN
ncbi:MAG: hypothetical protein ABIH18_09385 [Candidatus Omnitrophota bacterium]